MLEETRQRVERYPNDLQIRFELGELYFKAGKIKEAMGEFQKAQNNPNKRIQALTYLGQCFAKQGIYPLAVRNLETALKEKLVLDEEKKEIIYALGSVLRKNGQSQRSNRSVPGNLRSRYRLQRRRRQSGRVLFRRRPVKSAAFMPLHRRNSMRRGLSHSAPLYIASGCNPLLPSRGMTFLPLIERQLRVRSRQRAFYWSRFAIVLLGTLVVMPLLLMDLPREHCGTKRRRHL